MIQRAFEEDFSGLSACFTGRAAGDRPKWGILKPGRPERGEFRLYMPVQKHTGRVLKVTGKTPEREVADAVVTSERGLLLGVRVADCVPILLFDPDTPAVGAVHAGWRGTALVILRTAINRMVSEFNSVPERIHIAIGPSIRGCCYNVGPEVVESLSGTVSGHQGWMTTRGGVPHIDLAAVNRLQALEAGVVGRHIRVVPECTFCRHETYFSYRKEGPGAGRQAAFIGLNHGPLGAKGG